MRPIPVDGNRRLISWWTGAMMVMAPATTYVDSSRAVDTIDCGPGDDDVFVRDDATRLRRCERVHEVVVFGELEPADARLPARALCVEPSARRRLPA